MSKQVYVSEVPPCDVCDMMGDEHEPGTYNSPMTAEAQAAFGGSWANLCESHFLKHGIDTSVTERRVKS